MPLRARDGARMKITEVAVTGNQFHFGHLTEEERAEFEAVCKEWDDEATAKQDAEMSSENLKTEVVSD